MLLLAQELYYIFLNLSSWKGKNWRTTVCCFYLQEVQINHSSWWWLHILGIQQIWYWMYII